MGKESVEKLNEVSYWKKGGEKSHVVVWGSSKRQMTRVFARASVALCSPCPCLLAVPTRSAHARRVNCNRGILVYDAHTAARACERERGAPGSLLFAPYVGQQSHTRHHSCVTYACMRHRVTLCTGSLPHIHTPQSRIFLCTRAHLYMYQARTSLSYSLIHISLFQRLLANRISNFVLRHIISSTLFFQI